MLSAEPAGAVRRPAADVRREGRGVGGAEAGSAGRHGSVQAAAGRAGGAEAGARQAIARTVRGP